MQINDEMFYNQLYFPENIVQYAGPWQHLHQTILAWVLRDLSLLMHLVEFPEVMHSVVWYPLKLSEYHSLRPWVINLVYNSHQ